MARTENVIGAAEDATVSFVAPDAAFYRGVIDGMRCGIVAISPDGRIAMINEHARQILELGDEAYPGAVVERALRHHPQLARALRESFELSSLPNRAEIEIESRSQPGKTIGFTVSLVPADDGLSAGAAVFFKDLTHVEYKEERERLRDRLAALGQMAANLAHEIRNPLASIEVSCSLMKRRVNGDRATKDLLDKIIAEVRRLNGTITSSLEFVRPVSLSLAPASLDEILDAALAVAVGRRGRPGIRVAKLYDASIPDLVVDREQLRQVFENLFLNALEAMGDAGTLEVRTGTLPAPAAPSTPYRPLGASEPGEAWPPFDRYAVVRVSDTGPGVAEDVRDRLFYPFFTTKKHGSGVGLSMARKIVDSHRGLIDVESDPGTGAVFTVRLPMVLLRPEGPSR